VTAASTATDQRFQQGKITPSQANDQSQILSAAKRQMGAAGWGAADPWQTIKAGPVRVKPHKSQVCFLSRQLMDNCWHAPVMCPQERGGGGARQAAQVLGLQPL